MLYRIALCYTCYIILCCRQEIHPFEMGIGSGRTPKLTIATIIRYDTAILVYTMCVYIYIYIYMYIHTHTYTYTYTYIYIYT